MNFRINILQFGYFDVFQSGLSYNAVSQYLPLICPKGGLARGRMMGEIQNYRRNNRITGLNSLCVREWKGLKESKRAQKGSEEEVHGSDDCMERRWSVEEEVWGM